MRPTASIALLALALAAGCARTSKAPREESQAAMSSAPPAGKGSVYVYRLGRAVGAALAIQVKINGTEAAGLGPGTFCRWDLKPGRYTFHAATPESSATVALDVEAGKVYYIEQNLRVGIVAGRVTMKAVSPESGRAEVQSKELVVSAYVPSD